MTTDPTAASDQLKMWFRDLAEMEANYRDTLLSRGVPRKMANNMTEQLHDRFTAATFKSPATVFDIFK